MKKKTTLITILCIMLIVPSSYCFAQPYGQGIYSENVPYGDLTSLSITTSGNVTIPITPTDDGTLATSTNDITVTSTDVMGYKLYIRALESTDMDNLGDKLPTSSNEEPGALISNTWGYNTNASNLFTGLSLDDTLIRSISTPVSSGHITAVTYGIKVDMAKPAGNYIATVVYTAVPQTN